MLRPLCIASLMCLLHPYTNAVPLKAGQTEALSENNQTAADVDLCQQSPMRSGQLIECEAFIPMYTFNFQSGECEGYIYGGCGGSKNLFPTREECEQRCRQNTSRAKRSEVSKSACGEPLEKGRCLASFNRFAYNHEKGDCYEFTYGGCGGNANNFRNMAECLQTCAPDLLQVRNVDFDDRPSDAKIVVESN